MTARHTPDAAPAASPGAAPEPAPEPTSEPEVTRHPTPVGEARIAWYRPSGRGRPRAVLALGHGAGGGPRTARDLAALAAALPAHRVTVALVDQPWRVAGGRVAPAPARLDTAWRALWPALAAAGPPVVAGGRSAGARVACRTAAGLGAAAVLALAFPLHPPGRPERSRLAELLGAAEACPVLVVQGARDPFGRPEEFPAEQRPVPVPYGDHAFAVPKSAEVTEREALAVLTGAVADWLDRVLPGRRG